MSDTNDELKKNIEGMVEILERVRGLDFSKNIVIYYFFRLTASRNFKISKEILDFLQMNSDQLKESLCKEIAKDSDDLDFKNQIRQNFDDQLSELYRMLAVLHQQGDQDDSSALDISHLISHHLH